MNPQMFDSTIALYALPLLGKRVVVTRAAHQAGELVDKLMVRGAEPLLYPCIAIAPPDDTTLLDSAIVDLTKRAFDWLVLTSANVVLSLAQRLAALNLEKSTLAGLKVAAVGASTAQAARRELGIQVALQPDDYHAGALAEALKPTSGMSLFLPQADIASPDLRNALVCAGANVHTVTAYRTVIGSGGVNVPELLSEGLVDAVTFTSSSTVRNFIWRLVEEGGSTGDLAGRALVCIGPTTLKTARECGLISAVMPSVYTLDGLVHRLEDRFLC